MSTDAKWLLAHHGATSLSPGPALAAHIGTQARQVTDAYLLGLAVRHQCRFVSFDARISLAGVPGAEAGHLCVL